MQFAPIDLVATCDPDGPHGAANHGDEDAVAVISYDTGEREFETV